MVSLKDIATALKISRGLVSKVLNGRLGTTRVSPRTRNRILRKAEAMGYVPNRNVLALMEGRRGAIGIFINPWGEIGTEFIQDFLGAASHCLKNTPYHMWLNFFRSDSEFYQQMELKDVKRQVDGLVVGGGAHPQLLSHLRKVEEAGIPVVTFFEGSFSKALVNIKVDNYQQGYLPTTYLIDRGCGRIANFHIRNERHQGYVDALHENKYQLDRSLIVKCFNFSIAEGRAAVRKLIQNGVAFDGIVAQSDNQAFGACLELRDRGIAIPDQVRIIGVDDAPLCLASPVALSSVTSECPQLGSLTVETLLKKLAGEPVQSTVITPRIVKRNST